MAMASSRSLTGSTGASHLNLPSYGTPRQAAPGRSVCYCVVAYNPRKFYVLYEADWIQSLHLTQQMEQLYMQGDNYLDPTEIVIGMPVAARYLSGDLGWYRAKLLSFNSRADSYEIEFVDFAHSQTNSLGQLRTIPVKIVEFPPMALHCQLYGSDSEKFETPEIGVTFRDLIFNQWNKGKCVVSFLNENPPYFVRLWNCINGEELKPAFFGLSAVHNPPSVTTGPVKTLANGEVQSSRVSLGFKGRATGDYAPYTSDTSTSAEILTTRQVKFTSDVQIVSPAGGHSSNSKGNIQADLLVDLAEEPDMQTNLGPRRSSDDDQSKKSSLSELVRSMGLNTASPLDHSTGSSLSLPSGEIAAPQGPKKQTVKNFQWDAAVQTDFVPLDVIDVILQAEDVAEALKKNFPQIWAHLFAKTSD